MKDNRFLILMYHMISKPLNNSEKKYACPPDLFNKHMRFVHENYNTITLDDIAAHQRHCQPLTENSVAITLDDGFADNFEYGYPILQKYNIPATIFLTTGLLGNKNLWMCSRGFPERKLLSWDQIRQMQGLIQFGAHTVNHVRLPEIDQDMARQEIHDSKTAIEDNLGTEIKHFAYPYGLLNEQVVKLVKEAGFKSAYTTRSGFNNQSVDPFSLRRIEIFGNDPLWKVKQKLKFGINDAKPLYQLQYYFSRILVKLRLR
jgi:peptidoglycan/xylan/chitin deacetylase (PgdA/CDA1 family)